MIQGHWHWCHSIGHVDFLLVFHCNYYMYLLNLPPLTRYYHLFHKIQRGNVTIV